MSSQTGKETIYKQNFQTSLERANQPEWLKNLREKAFRYFTENGFPSVENEEWKYTNVAPMGRDNFLIAEFSENVADDAEVGKLEVGIEKPNAAANSADFCFRRIERERFDFHERAFSISKCRIFLE